jgi:hypothetical protein
MDIHVIGLDVDDEAREQLQQFAAVAGGNYHDAHSEADLDDALADINDSVVQTALALASTMETPTEEPPTVTDTAVPETPTPSPSPTLQPSTATFTPLPPHSRPYHRQLHSRPYRQQPLPRPCRRLSLQPRCQQKHPCPLPTLHPPRPRPFWPRQPSMPHLRVK